jgi:formylmethanofuran dehydrogenase subunit D
MLATPGRSASSIRSSAVTVVTLDVTDTTDLEALTASPIFNGVPVTVTRTSEEHP